LQEGLVEFGKITDEGIALLRERIGVERKKSNMHREGLLEITCALSRRFALGNRNQLLFHGGCNLS
jgi:hypothetical protein